MTIGSFLLPIILYAQGGFIVEGANVNITSGTTVRVDDGGVNASANAAIDNQGFFYLDRNWIQTGASTNYTGSGWMWFEGSTNQTISSVSPLIIPRLRVDNGQRLILQSPVIISNQVDLTNNGNIELGTNDLTLSSGSTIVNYDANHFVITNSTGALRQEVGNSNVIFPVGQSIYNPATLNNAGTTDNISVRVNDQVLDAYPGGDPEIEGVVSKAWFIEEDVNGGSDVTMTLQWDTSDELPNFSRTISGISHWLNGDWDRSPTWTNATNVGGSSWTQTRSGITSFSPFAVEDLQQDLPVELLTFNANRMNSLEVKLDWSTASETNNKGFEIQRMLDNETDFTTIGWVDGHGTTTATQYYDLLDDNAHTGISYYRLKQVDFDLSFTYSPTRAVRGAVSQGTITIFPNPTEAFLNIQFGEIKSQDVNIRIYAADGKLAFDRSVAIHQNHIVHLKETQAFASGAYLIQLLFEDGSTDTKRFIKYRD